MKYLKALAATFAFVLVLLAVYAAHVRYGKVDVVLYSAVLDAALAAAIVGGGLFALKAFAEFSRFEKVQMLCLWMLGGYAFAISVPTVIDRSLSFYLLEKIHQRGGGIHVDRLHHVVTQEYMVEHRLIDVRLTEQLQSGTIEVIEDCVRLTERGRGLVGFSQFFRGNLLPRQRLLLGEYSDDLTDPFRNSVADVSYRCG
ncbi:hypothetical protein [Lysobacter enzymogenes]|uniref:hypothetical protein n=1 Tax=Lysobacter enzymogenes TaxID=69 RepID=UPI00099B6365|nr:hypothetical protein [Lysobacter enzymogenes]UZW61638.1 hypothetical protein BV903_004855 [Lysobacter enzymogenes]